MSDLQEHLKSVLAAMEQQRNTLLRNHPEVSNPMTVEVLRRHVIWLAEAYCDLLKLTIEIMERHDAGSDD